MKEKSIVARTCDCSKFESVVTISDIDTIAEKMTVNYESSKNDKQRKEDEK